MDAEDRQREPMTDRVVDRELRALLAVDPSPEFVARIRTRIASEPAPSRFSIAGLQLPTASPAGLQLPTASWWLSWKLAGVVAVAAVVVLALVLARSRQTVAPTIAAGPKGPALQATETPAVAAGPKGPALQATETPAIAAGPKGPALQAPGQSAEMTSRRPVSPRRPGPPEPGASAPVVALRDPDVLLDPRETAALRALIRGVRRGDLDLEPVLRASAPSVMELPPITEIAIPPITIAPLVDEGVRP